MDLPVLDISCKQLHFRLIPDFKGKLLTLSPLGMIRQLWVFHKWPLSGETFCPTYNLLNNFVIKGYWILSNDFSASIEIIIWFLSFILLTWCITLTDFQMLNKPRISEINLTWPWSTILICFQIPLAIVLLMSFVSKFIRDIDLQFSFLVMSLSSYGVLVIIASE